ncbi:MAG: ABC transporter substrate-binding protein [Myxococcales bacterium]|nr:ABC transporter substrate-binding protein [Myxococcales bacterium]
MNIRLAFSPDSDDLFMFYALVAGKIDTGGLTFTAERADTESLNARADAGDVDVLAVSIARYATIHERYQLLPHGASVGRGYGPVVVTVPGGATSLDDLREKRVGIPGARTTAALVLRILMGARPYEPVVLPISPYARTFEALRGGEVAAALLIHEGRLTYEREGFARVLDIGEAWASQTGGLPLPLGGNVIRRDLGAPLIAKVSDLCRKSIEWAIAHHDEVAQALLAADERADVGLDAGLLNRYLAMYANEDTRDMREDVVRAMAELFRRGADAGVFLGNVPLDLAP